MDHFENVKDRQANPDSERIDDAPLVQNDLTKHFKT